MWRKCPGEVVIALALGLVAAGCWRNDMRDQQRYEPLEGSTFFKDGRSSRDPVPGTVARGQLMADEHFYTGKANGQVVDTFPFAMTEEVLKRGERQFNVFCSPCHSRVGDGTGMIVQRGYRQPPSFHIDRLRKAPVGHFYDVITNGYGAMAPYAAQVTQRDRWAIAGYIRALQLSQAASIDDVPPAERAKLGGNP